PLDLLLLEPEPARLIDGPLVQVLVLGTQADGRILEPGILRLEGLTETMTLVQPRLRDEATAAQAQAAEPGRGPHSKPHRTEPPGRFDHPFRLLSGRLRSVEVAPHPTRVGWGGGLARRNGCSHPASTARDQAGQTLDDPGADRVTPELVEVPDQV